MEVESCVCVHVLVRIGAPRAAKDGSVATFPFAERIGGAAPTATRHVNVHITYQPVPLP